MREIIAFNFISEDTALNNISYTGPHRDGLNNKGGSWNWSNYKTPTYRTGPQNKTPEGYVYTESSSPTGSGDKFYFIIDTVIDLTSTVVKFNFKYNMHTKNSCAINIYGWNNNRWINVDTITPTTLDDVWVEAEVNFNTFINNKFQIKVEVTMSNSWSTSEHDVAFKDLRLILDHNTDAILQYYFNNGIERYNNNTPIFDATAKTTSDLINIMNAFIDAISDYDFSFYPNGIFITGPDKIYYINADSEEYVVILSDVLECSYDLTNWSDNATYRIFGDITNSTTPTVGYNVSKYNNAITYTLDEPTDFNSKHYRLWLISDIFKYGMISKVEVSFYDTDDNVSTWDITNMVVNDEKAWVNVTFYTCDCNTDIYNANMSNIERIVTTLTTDYLGDEINTWMSPPTYVDELVVTGRDVDNSSLYNIVKVLKNNNIITMYNDVAAITGRVIIGSIDRITYFNIHNTMFKYRDLLINPELYTLKLIGDLSKSSEFHITNSTINGSVDKFKLDASDPNIKQFTLHSCRVSNVDELLLGSNFNTSTVSYNTFSLSKDIDINGATFTNNVISNPIGYGVRYTNTSAIFNNIYFLEYTTPVLYIDPSITEITLDNIWFMNPTNIDGIHSLYWANTTDTLTINLLGVSNIEITGCLSMGGNFNLVDVTPDDGDSTNDEIIAKMDAMAQNIRYILAAQGEDIKEMETVIISNGVRLVL